MGIHYIHQFIDSYEHAVLQPCILPQNDTGTPKVLHRCMVRAQHYPRGPPPPSKLKLLHMVARINDASPLRYRCTETYIKLRKYCISVLRAGRFLLASKHHPKLEDEKHTIDVADRARTTTEDCRALDYN